MSRRFGVRPGPNRRSDSPPGRARVGQSNFAAASVKLARVAAGERVELLQGSLQPRAPLGVDRGVGEPFPNVVRRLRCAHLSLELYVNQRQIGVHELLEREIILSDQHETQRAGRVRLQADQTAQCVERQTADVVDHQEQRRKSRRGISRDA